MQSIPSKLIAFTFFSALAVFAIYTYLTLVLPMPRAGTEIYDLFNAARNLSSDFSWANAYLFDQRVSPPGVPQIYQHAPNNLRLVSLVLIKLGLDTVSMNSLVLVLAQVGILSLILFYLFRSIEGAFALVLIMAMFVADQYFLTKIINPLRLTQYLLFFFTMYLCCARSHTKGLLVFVFFFIVWQTELVFAAFISSSFVLFHLFAKWRRVRLFVVSIIPCVGGFLISIGIFCFQLFLFRSFSFISDWIGVTAERNTVLYTWFLQKENPYSFRDLVAMYGPDSLPLDYRVPQSILEFIQHLLAMICGRFDAGFWVLPTVTVFSSIFVFVKYRDLSQTLRNLYAYIISSVFGLLIVSSIFRGYVSYLYLKLHEPLIDMVLYSLLTLNFCALSELSGSKKYVSRILGILILVPSIFVSSSNRWESTIRPAAPLSRELLSELARPDFRGAHVFANFNDNYAIPGLIHTHILKLDSRRLSEEAMWPEMVDYYICSKYVAKDDCRSFSSQKFGEHFDVMFEDNSGVIYGLKHEYR